MGRYRARLHPMFQADGFDLGAMWISRAFRPPRRLPAEQESVQRYPVGISERDQVTRLGLADLPHIYRSLDDAERARRGRDLRRANCVSVSQGRDVRKLSTNPTNPRTINGSTFPSDRRRLSSVDAQTQRSRLVGSSLHFLASPRGVCASAATLGDPESHQQHVMGRVSVHQLHHVFYAHNCHVVVELFC